MQHRGLKQSPLATIACTLSLLKIGSAQSYFGPKRQPNFKLKRRVSAQRSIAQRNGSAQKNVQNTPCHDGTSKMNSSILFMQTPDSSSIWAQVPAATQRYVYSIIHTYEKKTRFDCNAALLAAAARKRNIPSNNKGVIFIYKAARNYHGKNKQPLPSTSPPYSHNV